MIDTWQSTLRICVVAIVCTACAIAFMMLTASNPSADDFWRAVGVAGGGTAAYFVGRKSVGTS